MKGIYLAILTVFLMVTGLRAAEVEVLKPKGNLEIKLGHPSTISLYDMPAVLTHERLNKNGWNVKSVEFTRTDLNVQALAQGTIQIANSQVMDPVRAIQKGAKLSFVMENNGGEFLMIAKNEIKDCKDTDGKRFAIHGEAATTSLAAKLWLLNECKVKPNIMVIPGGENRIIALQNNQIDATLVQLGDWLNLDSKAPGRYHIIKTGGLFNISGASYWGNVEWLRKNEEVAIAYIAELLKSFRMVHANPKILGADGCQASAGYAQTHHRPGDQSLYRGCARLAAERRRHFDPRRHGKVFYGKRRAQVGREHQGNRRFEDTRGCT